MAEKKYSIVVIDDEPLIVSAVKFQLRKHFEQQFEIESANNATEGLALINSIILSNMEVPLVICDYLMPGVKGDDLIVELHNQHHNTSSVLLTGQIDVQAMGNIVNHAKLFRYLAKPWDEMDLILTVREAISAYRLIMTVDEQNRQITDYAFSNAHKVRGPLSRILGLIYLMKREPEIISTENLMDKLEISAIELDTVVRDISKILAEKK